MIAKKNTARPGMIAKIAEIAVSASSTSTSTNMGSGTALGREASGYQCD